MPRQTAKEIHARRKRKRDAEAAARRTRGVVKVEGDKKPAGKPGFDQAAHRPAGGLGGLARRAGRKKVTKHDAHVRAWRKHMRTRR